jgi:hypothetical protein
MNKLTLVKLSLKFWHNSRINFDKTIIQNVQGKECENITETELWPYLINFNEEGDEEDITFEMEGLTDKVKHKISRFNILFPIIIDAILSNEYFWKIKI